MGEIIEICKIRDSYLDCEFMLKNSEYFPRFKYNENLCENFIQKIAPLTQRKYFANGQNILKTNSEIDSLLILRAGEVMLSYTTDIRGSSILDRPR